MAKNRMTVKELKELLNNYTDNLIVEIDGGGNDDGNWAWLRVGALETNTIVNHLEKTYEYVHFTPMAILMEEEV